MAKKLVVVAAGIALLLLGFVVFFGGLGNPEPLVSNLEASVYVTGQRVGEVKQINIVLGPLLYDANGINTGVAGITGTVMPLRGDDVEAGVNAMHEDGKRKVRAARLANRADLKNRFGSDRNIENEARNAYRRGNGDPEFENYAVVNFMASLRTPTYTEAPPDDGPCKIGGVGQPGCYTRMPGDYWWNCSIAAYTNCRI